MIRSALSSDAQAIAELSGQLGYTANAIEMRERLERNRARADNAVLVADVDGRVVGWIHVYGVHAIEVSAQALIGGLVVDQRHRGAGIGSELLTAAEKWASENGYGVIRVRSNVMRKEAHVFYERLGYRVAKLQTNFVKELSRKPEGAGSRAGMR